MEPHTGQGKSMTSRTWKPQRHAVAAIGASAPLPSMAVDPLITERTIFNVDRTHRFTLFRHWGDADDFACGISMNPSGAAEDVSDPTVDGMCRRAREYWGVGAYYQLNVGPRNVLGGVEKDRCGEPSGERRVHPTHRFVSAPCDCELGEPRS